MRVLQCFVLVTLLGAIALNFATLREAAGEVADSATTLSKPDTKVMDWTHHPESKCSKQTSLPVIEESDPHDDSEAARLLADGKSVPGWGDFIKGKLGMQKDAAAKYGFDVTDLECRERCKESVGCKFYSFGMWTKGWGPLFGGYYGKMRCQLYSSCDISTFIRGYMTGDGMEVFEKIWIAIPSGKSDDVTDDVSTAAPTHRNSNVIAAMALLTALNAGVLFMKWNGMRDTITASTADKLRGADHIKKASTACCVVASAVAVWLVQEAGFQLSPALAFQLLYPLAAVHALNILGLLCVALLAPPLTPLMAAEIIIHRDEILKEGWLSKQSVHMKTWRRRWCVLTPQYLCTFKSQGEYRNPTEAIRVREFSTVKSADEDTGKDNSFRVDTSQRVFYLIADTTSEKEGWIGHIGRQMVRPTMMTEDNQFE